MAKCALPAETETIQRRDKKTNYVMIAPNRKADLSHAVKGRLIRRRGLDWNATGRAFPEHFERLIPSLNVFHVLRGPLFRISIAFVGVSVIAVTPSSLMGLVPNALGHIVAAVWMVLFWAAMITAFAGRIVRSES